MDWIGLPSGKHTKNYGKSPFLMGKSTINVVFSIAMLNYQRVAGKILKPCFFLPSICWGVPAELFPSNSVRNKDGN